MCGICGWYNRIGHVDSSVVLKMNQVARHRGPDDEGYTVISEQAVTSLTGDDSIELPYDHISSLEYSPCSLMFAHRRLSIIDLSPAGHQPMISDDDGLCITFNGEIYNYIELRDELESLGYRFRSSSDTEVLLMAYREWGEDCVRHLNGMWGFALWDSDNRKIFCSRDRLGAKPFHYYVDDDNFVFGSELKQLTQNPIVPRVMNEEMLSSFMFFSLYDYSEDTLIKDIKVLKGGYNLSYTLPETKEEKAVLTVYKYWDINTNCQKRPDAIDEAIEYHRNAVNIRLRSDVPIGLMLSGGLDSSVLVAEVSNLMKRRGLEAGRINTFTSCYDDYTEGDEREFAKQVNSFCGTKENLIYPDEEDTFSVFSDMVWHMEGLAEFYSMGGFLTLREVSKSGNKVIINGQGADETMFGYERYYIWYLKDVLKKKGLVAYVRELNKAVRNSRLGYKDILLYNAYFGNRTVRRLRCRSRLKPYVSREMMDSFDNNTDIDRYLSFSNLSEMQYNEIRGTQLTHILRMDDRNYMAFSMESRVPFIDYRYVESAVQIPESLKIRDGYTKYILRDYIKNDLPKEVVWRKNKMGWPSPRERWIRRLNADSVSELFENPRSSKYFNIAKVKELSIKDPTAFAFEKFLGVELFMRLFDVCAEV